MNHLTGIIKDIKSHLGILCTRIQVAPDVAITSVIVDSPDISEYVQLDADVDIWFKETEVSIAVQDYMGLSIQNKIPCVIDSIIHGEILSQINMTFKQTFIRSIITQNACIALNLKEGDRVYALVKSNEIMLSAHVGF